MKYLVKMLFTTAAIATLASCSTEKQKLQYPQAPTDDTVDTYPGGLTVADPYRPLENDTSQQTLQWVDQQREITANYLNGIPFRSKVHNRLEQLANYPKHGTPSKAKDGRYYFFENSGLQNQSVLYRSTSLTDEPELFLDPNTLSDDGTVALTGIFMSNNGKYMAYTISRSGSDWTEIYVKDTETGETLTDHIEWAKFTGAEWDGDGFYYSAYPRPEQGKEFSNANENHIIYYHKLGTPQSADRVVYADNKNPLYFFGAQVDPTERYLFITGSGQGLGNSLIFKDLSKAGAQWTTIEPSQDYEIALVDVVDNNAILLTNLGAPNNRLVKVDLSNPAKENWTDLLPQTDAVLTAYYRVGPDKFIATHEQDASDHAALYALDGNKIRDIEFPTLGSAAFSTNDDNEEVFYSFNSFLYPGSTFTYDVATGTSQLLRENRIEGFNPDDYTTEQVFYTSADGTQVPMFVTHKKDIKLDGNNPTLLYGYGGFNISLTPSFSPYRLFWLENGGVYAMANLRGGSEYGEPWHLAGTKMNKQNVFDDFTAAAQYLIDNKWTSPSKLAVNGGSNGGLLVGAVVNQHPELFRVAIPQVGVMDMMRYHLFTIGWNWASDYGRSDDSPEMAAYLLNYSPLHNIKNDGTPYPAIMVTTADHDDRVVPAHSFKYAAALQAADTGNEPKIIRIDSKAGHGAGKPIAKTIDEQTDIYSFILYNMGLEPTE